MLASLVLACATEVPATTGETAPPASELASLATRRILFGHQSVGENILHGVGRELRARQLTLRVVELSDGAAIPSGTLAHRKLGRNEDPLSKLEAFVRELTRTPDTDVAFLKFCYIDFHANTDVGALFARYRETFTELRARYPRVMFAHITVPLTTVQRGPKAWLKSLTGRSPYGTIENSARERFNDLLRAEYQSAGLLFDLARLESTGADGREETFEHEGRAVRALIPRYSDDGGHLNDAGQDWIAPRFLDFLARLPVASTEG